MIRNHTTTAGAALGRELARLVDEAEPRARLVEPTIPPRCASCAFRAGSHTANGSEITLGDALKCVLENVEFQCHEPARAGQPCSGWRMLQLAHPSAPGSVPWGFSDEVETRRDPHGGDTMAQGEGHDGPPLGSLAGSGPPEAARYGHHDHTSAQDRLGMGDAVTACPSASEGLPAIQAPLRAKGLAEIETLSRPEGVQRTRSEAGLAAAATEPAPEYARRHALPLDARSTP